MIGIIHISVTPPSTFLLVESGTVSVFSHRQMLFLFLFLAFIEHYNPCVTFLQKLII